MSRAARLLDLVQALRRRRAPAPGRELAEELGVSLRTLYRDVETLRAQGAAVEGEAGVGYVLRPGFTLPPLMFTQDEIAALSLGLRWVAKQGDAALGAAARDALAKIAAVLPPERDDALASATLIPVAPRFDDAAARLPVLRAALSARRKLELDYVDAGGSVSLRVVWPTAIGFFDAALVLAAWCELRADFRHFRLDRIRDARMLDARIPMRAAALLRDWRKSAGLDAADGI
ncbi:MAG: YafY family transcriptional regulator [Rhodoblastus sp.]|nr:MAG: YafY family transcriptional regulator [Rhodoblastus sp.]